MSKIEFFIYFSFNFFLVLGLGLYLIWYTFYKEKWYKIRNIKKARKLLFKGDIDGAQEVLKKMWKNEIN